MVIQVILLAQTVKNLPALQETQVQSLGWEDALEKRMVTHSSILAWRSPWTEKLGGLQSMGSWSVRHNWAKNNTLLHIHVIYQIWLANICSQNVFWLFIFIMAFFKLKKILTYSLRYNWNTAYNKYMQFDVLTYV